MKSNLHNVSYSAYMTTSFSQSNRPDTLYDLLSLASQQKGEETGLSAFFPPEKYRQPKQWSFAEVLQEVNQTANMFHALGIKKTDTIAFLLPNIAESCFVFWGAASIATVFPIHPGLEAYQIGDLLEQSEARILVTTAPFAESNLWDKIELIRPHLSFVKTILQIDLVDYLSTLQKASMRFTLRKKGKAEKISGQEIGDFNRTRAKFSEDSLLSAPPQSQDIAVLLHSSGTHHEPEIRPFSHEKLLLSAQKLLAEPTGDQTTAIWSSYPISHGMGLVGGNIMPWLSGREIVLGEVSGPEMIDQLGIGFTLDGKPFPNTHMEGPLWQELPFLREIQTGESLVDLDKVEKITASHPHVEAVVVIPSPDNQLGWVPVAFIQPKKNIQISPKAVYDFLVKAMPDPAMIPQGIRIVDQMPLSITEEAAIYQLTRDEIETTIRKISHVTKCKAVCHSDGSWSAYVGLSSPTHQEEFLQKTKGFPVEIIF
ncbi:MAG: AMP-binding protein [Bacteroidia bacterium]